MLTSHQRLHWIDFRRIVGFGSSPCNPEGLSTKKFEGSGPPRRLVKVWCLESETENVGFCTLWVLCYTYYAILYNTILKDIPYYAIRVPIGYLNPFGKP